MLNGDFKIPSFTAKILPKPLGSQNLREAGQSRNLFIGAGVKLTAARK